MAVAVVLARVEEDHQEVFLAVVVHQAEEVLENVVKENADQQEIESLSAKKEVLVQIVVRPVLEIENQEGLVESQNIKIKLIS
jgi:hypothetical protein